MLNFREYVTEGGDDGIAVISISKEHIDCSLSETLDEINDDLEDGLEGQNYLSPYGGWVRASKVLSLYGIILPNVIFKDINDGEEVVAIQQLGHKVGANLDGTINMQPDVSEYYFFYSYGRGEDGYYDTFAAVVNEGDLDYYVSDDTEHLNPEGEEQPPQE